MEVMGLMLGMFVDDYTTIVLDVFAMPQSGTGVSVEAVDPIFQTNMLDMLKQTGRPEMVVGWYHSHPGFGCWLSGVDINTQQGKGRAFCAGGDVAAVVCQINEGNWRLGAIFFKKEFTLNYLMATYSKPQVSILNGIVMGGGAGASIHGRFCAATENSSFEALSQRAIAVVVDPIQSVKGKVVIDAFRLINPQTMMLGQEPRQTTSNIGYLNKPRQK